MEREAKLHKEYFDVYYDVEESLRGMIQEEMDHIYKKRPRSHKNLDKMKRIRDRVVEAAADIKNANPSEIQNELEAIRRD